MKYVRASDCVHAFTERPRRCAVLIAIVLALVVLSGRFATTSAAGQGTTPAAQQGQTLVGDREIAMKITAPFTLAADLGQDGSRPFSRLGLPMIPAPDMSRRVLEKLQRLSKPFGTTINIENGVGVIRVAAGPRTR